MSVLLKEIKHIDPTAASKLERLKFCTDSDLKSLTHEELRELFPGEYNLRMRKTIFETIHKQRPIGLVLNEMKDFIPDESLRAALSDTGVLVDYLHLLKDMKTQMNNVQTFLDAHISLLEDIKKSQSDKKPDEGGVEANKTYLQDPKYSSSVLSSSSSSLPADTHKSPEESKYPPISWWSGSSSTVSTETQKFPPEDPPQRSLIDSPGTSRANSSGPVHSVNPTGLSSQTTRKTIKYKMELSGNTLNAHMQILDRVKSQDSSLVSLNLVEGRDDSDVTLLFCPIVSRTGTDVETAMKQVKGDKRVILVLMRHSHEAKPVTSKRTWSNFPHVVLHVIVFYHDTVKGLLNCQENTHAISEIRKELLKHSYETPEVTVDPECGKNDIYPYDSAHKMRRSSSQKKSSSFWHWPLSLN